LKKTQRMKVVTYILDFIGFCILILVNSGCSFVNKVSVLEANKSPNWSECGTCYSYYTFKLSTKSYQYLGDSVSFIICPCAKPSSNILIGPPFIPVIPNPFAWLHQKPDVKFFVDMKIDSHHKNVTIDLSRIKFQIFKDTLSNPTIIRIITNRHYGEPEEFFDHRKDLNGKFVNYSDSILYSSIITITNPLIVRFEFGEMTTKVKQLLVRFDPSVKNDSISQIRFKKHNKFVYRPFYNN
jgi:hypothetical protein